MILGKVVPAQGKPDLTEKAERAFRQARERREEAVRAELREKIAAGVGAEVARRKADAESMINKGLARYIDYEVLALVNLAARIRAGEFG